MPKNKKAKTHHHRSTPRNPSHEEIWDDSALIRSWNDAVAEYEYYHSIHAKGEDLEEILRKAEAEETAEQEEAINADIEDGEVTEDEIQVQEPPLDVPTAMKQQNPLGPAEQAEMEGGTETKPPLREEAGNAETEAIKTPVAPLQGSVEQDQTLENIKMAYYWAGYYSGLYDGQQQAKRETA